MTSSSWNDPTLTKTTASLNEELERIFEQVEKAVRKAGPVSEESLPRLEILPDDFDPSETQAQEPARAEVLSGDFDLAVGRISPADAYGDGHLAADFDEFDLAVAQISPAGHSEPELPDLSLAGPPAGIPLRLEPDAFRLSGAEAEKAAEAASALTPEELARLIERAVEKGVLAALKQQGR